MSPAADWKFNLRIGEAKAETEQAIFNAVQELFELDIKPEAIRGSPVLTGTNRRSIDTTVEKTAQGTKASLYTQSGYGGFLEVGTRRMQGRPYLYPAFQKFFPQLQALVAKYLFPHG